MVDGKYCGKLCVFWRLLSVFVSSSALYLNFNDKIINYILAIDRLIYFCRMHQEYFHIINVLS